MSSTFDHCQRFIFENTRLRGEIVRITTSWQQLISRHDYPENIRNVLGECVAAALLLSSTLKYQGSVTLQIQGKGPVHLLVVQVTSEKTFRAVVEFKPEASSCLSLAEMFADANLIMTLESSRHKERYQSIIALNHATLSAAIDEYFGRSVQLRTRLWLGSSADSIGGLLLQEMPETPTIKSDESYWEHIQILSETITTEELCGLHTEQILHRLYHQETVRLFDADPIRFYCPCSKARFSSSLASLGRAEVGEIIATQGIIHIQCDFCLQEYEFDRVDVEAMFAENMVSEVPKSTH